MARRWIVGILLAMGLSLGIFMVKAQHNTMNFRHKKVQALERRLDKLRFWFEQHKEKQERLRQWQIVCKEVRAAGLVPRNWQKYPFQVETTLDWSDCEQILLLISNDWDGNQGVNFWFVPEKLMISKGGADPKNTDSEKNKSKSPFNELKIFFSGEFLKPIS